MNRISRTWLRAAIIAIGVAMMLVPSVAAYEGEVDAQIGVNGPTTTHCTGPVEITARVFDKEGNPLAGREVVWSTGEVGTTDAHGLVHLTVIVSADVTVKATTGESSAQITITCERGAVAGAQGLPRTDTEAPSSLPSTAILAALALLGVALVARRILITGRS